VGLSPLCSSRRLSGRVPVTNSPFTCQVRCRGTVTGCHWGLSLQFPRARPLAKFTNPLSRYWDGEQPIALPCGYVVARKRFPGVRINCAPLGPSAGVSSASACSCVLATAAPTRPRKSSFRSPESRAIHVRRQTFDGALQINGGQMPHLSKPSQAGRLRPREDRQAPVESAVHLGWIPSARRRPIKEMLSTLSLTRLPSWWVRLWECRLLCVISFNRYRSPASW